MDSWALMLFLFNSGSIMDVASALAGQFVRYAWRWFYSEAGSLC